MSKNNFAELYQNINNRDMKHYITAYKMHRNQCQNGAGKFNADPFRSMYPYRKHITDNGSVTVGYTTARAFHILNKL